MEMRNTVFTVEEETDRIITEVYGFLQRWKCFKQSEKLRMVIDGEVKSRTVAGMVADESENEK